MDPSVEAARFWVCCIIGITRCLSVSMVDWDNYCEHIARLSPKPGEFSATWNGKGKLKKWRSDQHNSTWWCWATEYSNKQIAYFVWLVTLTCVNVTSRIIVITKQKIGNNHVLVRDAYRILVRVVDNGLSVKMDTTCIRQYSMSRWDITDYTFFHDITSNTIIIVSPRYERGRQITRNGT